MQTKHIQNRILIVEDDASLLHGLIDKFTHEKFHVLSATNGIDGLASALVDHPDVILLDILMPQMDGLTMLQKLRESGAWGRSVAVIFLTNLSSENEKIMARIVKDEPVFYLVKSAVSLQDVVDKVKACLADSAAEEHADLPSHLILF
jgi:DNA-binding response OmpR family regulator